MGRKDRIHNEEESMVNQEHLWVIEIKSPFIAGPLRFYPRHQTYRTRKEARAAMAALPKGNLAENRVRKYKRVEED